MAWKVWMWSSWTPRHQAFPAAASPKNQIREERSLDGCSSECFLYIVKWDEYYSRRNMLKEISIEMSLLLRWAEFYVLCWNMRHMVSCQWNGISSSHFHFRAVFNRLLWLMNNVKDSGFSQLCTYCVPWWATCLEHCFESWNTSSSFVSLILFLDCK